MHRILGIGVFIVLLSSCMKEPNRLIEYKVRCVHCAVDHIDGSGVASTDTVFGGFLLRFEREVGESIKLETTNIATDPGSKAEILVDAEVHASGTATGTPGRIVLNSEVPERKN